MAEEEKSEPTRAVFPTARVKRIMKLDNDINKVNSDALFLVSRSVELFLRFLAEKSAVVATEKKRKTVSLDHLTIAVKRHQPTSDFLLDSLPAPAQTLDQPVKQRAVPSESAAEKPAPAGTRRIDHFFHKTEAPSDIQINDS